MSSWSEINVNKSFNVRFMTNSFKRSLMQLIAKEKADSLEAMDVAMLQFKTDCLDKIPKCPVDKGDLRAAHNIVESVRKGSAVIGTLRVEKPYAASLHEGISRYGQAYVYHTLETGSHWVLSKLLMFGKSYIKLIAEGTLSPTESSVNILKNVLSSGTVK